MEEEGVAYWDIQMFNVDETGEYYEMPIVFLGVEAKSKTALNGTYDLLLALYGNTLDEETYEVDGVWNDETIAATLTIKNVDNDNNYSFVGTFVGEDGKTYKINTVANVYAEDDATEEVIELNEEGTDEPGDDPVTPPSEGVITCAEAVAICEATGETSTTETYTIRGYVTEIKTAYSEQYGNISFWMADTPDGGQVLQAYRVKPVNAAKDGATLYEYRGEVDCESFGLSGAAVYNCQRFIEHYLRRNAGVSDEARLRAGLVLEAWFDRARIQFRGLTPRPMKEAIVTIGGVARDDVDPATMESRKVPHLYFAGEVLDIDGPTGGYNLTLAFATARKAVASIA